MGTPQFAVPSLQALLAADYEIKGVFTQPDRPVGRGQQVAFSPIKQVALEHHLPIFQPQRLRGDVASLEALSALSPDLIVVVAYGQILPEAVLSLPSHGCINLHGSLLPQYRGAAPIQWAILNGETETGLTTMLMEKGLDTGPMLLKVKTAIDPRETSEALSARLSDLGGGLLVETLSRWLEGDLTPIPQDSTLASYAPMLKKEMAPLDWSLSAQTLVNRVRGLYPWPGTTTALEGEGLKVLEASLSDVEPHGEAPGTLLRLGSQGWDVATGEGALRIEKVQLAGKKPQEAAVQARGWRALTVGVRFDA